MATLEEIGKATKAKYPQYAGKTDAEVGQAVVNKYPEYKAKLTSSDTRNPLQKVADFMGLGNTINTLGIVGSSIMATPSSLGPDYTHIGLTGSEITNQDKKGQGIFKQSQALIKQAMQEKDPVKKQVLLQQSRQLDQSIGQAGQTATDLANKIQTAGQITPSEMNMSNGEFALRRGGATAAEVGSYLVPGAGEAGTVGGRLINAGVRGAEAGALQGAAGAAKESTNPLDALLRVGTGGVVGGVTGAGVQGLFETGGAVANAFKDVAGLAKNKLVDLYKSSLKENIGDKKFYQQYGGEDKVVADALKYKVPTTKAGVEKELSSFRKEYNTIIENETKRLQSQGKRINLARAFKTAKDEIQKKFGYDETLLKSANNWFDSNAKYKNATNALPKTANELRKMLDKRVGDILTSDAAPADAARKAFATQLRKEFKNLASSETKDAITKYHLLSGLSSAMQKEPVTSLPELMGASIFRSNPLSAVLGLAGTKAVRSPGLKRAIVVGADKLASSPRVNVSQINPTPVVNPAVSALQRALDNKLKFNTSTTRLPSASQ